MIANNSTANPEIADEKCGLSFNNNDVTEIVSAIENMRSRLQNHDLKEICVQRALNEFDFNKQIKNIYHYSKHSLTLTKNKIYENTINHE